MDSIVFTPAALLDILSSIEELADKEISLSEISDGSVELHIGDSLYTIPASNADEVEVDEEVIEQVDAISEDAFDDMDAITDEELIDESELVEDETVESSIIKEIAKTLLVGGMVRLTAKMLSKK